MNVSAVGPAAYATQYPGWQGSSGLASTVGAFVTGSANFVAALGVPMTVAVALMGVLVASFAGTTMDTACRLQRYVVQELAATLFGSRAQRAATVRERGGRSPRDGSVWHAEDAGFARPAPSRSRLVAGSFGDMLADKHVATSIAVLTAAALAAIPAPGEAWSLTNAGRGGMTLWPLFGASNQLLAGLAFLVILFYLRRRAWATWFLIGPMAFMLVMPAWAMLHELPGWARAGRWPLAGIAVAVLALEVWMVAEAALMFPRVRGVPERDPSADDPSANRGFEVLPSRA